MRDCALVHVIGSAIFRYFRQLKDGLVHFSPPIRADLCFDACVLYEVVDACQGIQLSSDTRIPRGLRTEWYLPG